MSDESEISSLDEADVGRLREHYENVRAPFKKFFISKNFLGSKTRSFWWGSTSTRSTNPGIGGCSSNWGSKVAYDEKTEA